MAEKKRTPISPLAKEDKPKRFSFDSYGKRPVLCARDSKAGIELMVTDADKASRPESPQSDFNESEPAISPGTIRRDNIDGCESEKEIFDIGERTNVGFSGDEEEGMCDIKSGEPFFIFNPSAKKIKTTKDTVIGMGAFPDAKEQTGSNINDATIDPHSNLFLTTESAHDALSNYPQKEDLGNDVPNGTSTRRHGVSEQFETKIDKNVRDPTLSDQTEALFSVAKPNAIVLVPQLDYVLESTPEDVQTSPKNSGINGELDHNDNLPNAKRLEEGKLPVHNAEIKQSLAETKTTAGHEGENMKLTDTQTVDVVVHDGSVVGEEPVVRNEESTKDGPAYKKKLQPRKRDKKKSDRIEKTFFV